MGKGMILELLKERTRDLHTQVERTVDLPTRLQSRLLYASLLSRFYGFYGPLEDRLAAVEGLAAAALEFEGRRKAPLLRDDLTALGLGEADIRSLPRCERLPSVTDTGDALGCLYVLEGATLGGQVVRRLVEQRLGLAAGRGCSFFDSYGERVGVMWREFRRFVEGYVMATPGAGDRVIAAAVGTFSSLDRWVVEGAAC
jgi:heme oxygenase